MNEPWAITLLVVMATVYGGMFPIAWIIVDRDTRRRIREMEDRLNKRPGDVP